MKVTAIAAPTDIKQAPPTNTKAKAIEAFNNASKTQQPMSHSINPNNVSVEELSAIQPQTAEVIDKNTDNVEAPAAEETAEAAATEVKLEEKSKEDPALSRQFAQLARQERALRAKAQKQILEFKAKEDALKAREEALTAENQKYKTGYVSVERFKNDPVGVMAETGLSYDEITQQLINQAPKDPRMEATISRLEAKIKQLEDSNENNQKTYQQQQQDSYKAAVNQIRLDTKNLVNSDLVAYEAISKTNSINDVVELIEQTYQKDGILLSVEEAAQEVENYLVEEGVNMTSKIEKIKKRMQANAQPPAKPSIQKPQPTQSQQPTMKTLTNAAASTRQLSAKERAILAFKGELKG